MATNRTDSLIAASGGDYTSIQAWFDDIGTGLGTSTNLVTDDYEHHAWVKGWFTQDLTVNGLTCDSTHFIKIQADHSSRPGGSGTPSDEGVMDADRALTINTSYAGFTLNQHNSSSWNIQDSDVRLERLQLHCSGKSNPGCAYIQGSRTIINRCIMRRGSASGGHGVRFHGSYSGHQVLASLGYHQSGAPSPAMLMQEDSAKIYNCTLSRDYAGTGTVLHVSYERPDIQNCALFSHGAGTEIITCSGAASWSTLDYNATDHSDISSKSGEGSNNTYSLTSSDELTATDGSDFRLKSGNSIGSGGTDLTATCSVDIFGTSFAGGEIGCHKLVAAGGAGLPAGSLALGGVGI